MAPTLPTMQMSPMKIFFDCRSVSSATFPSFMGALRETASKKAYIPATSPAET